MAAFLLAQTETNRELQMAELTHDKATSIEHQGEVLTSDIEGMAVEKKPGLPNIDSDHSPYNRIGLLVLFIVFGIFGTWSATAPLDSAAVAHGTVFVASNNRVVQHYEGGMVSEILVKEGQEVESGQTLVRLSPTQAQSELSVVSARLNELYALEARLKSERKLADQIEFPRTLLDQSNKESIKEIMQGQEDVFNARRNSLEGELKIYNQRIAALNEQINGLMSVNSTLDERISSYELEVKDWEALYKEQYADKIRLQEMRRELSRLIGERGIRQSEIARLKVQISETKSQLVLRKQQFREEVVSLLREIQSERVELESRKIALADRLERLEIKAPVSGTINGLGLYTIGEVISSGQTLMEVVPRSKDYAVKAQVMVTDIDKVTVGLIADVRFSAFNTQLTHVIEGEVYHLSADKFVNEQSGLEYFEAKVMLTDSGVAQMAEDGIFMLPGMPAEVMIKIGERTLLDYFTKPFTNMFARSFNED